MTAGIRKAATVAGDPVQWSLVEAARALRSGDIDAQDYAQALIERGTAHAGLNAFATFDADRLREDARAADAARRCGEALGPLHGLPIALKDNITTRRWPTGAGTAALRHWVAGSDATVVQRLLQAGALVAGKTTMHELAMGWTGQNAAFGDTRNPHAPGHMAGGSSGGSACAVAAHLVPGAIGTDTNGSIRVPAAFCGSVGLRPTHGRYPLGGVVPLAPSMDTIGPLGRSVADVALLDAVLAGEPSPPTSLREATTLRLGVCRHWFWERLDDAVEQAAESALGRLQHAGVRCELVVLPALPELVEQVAATVIGFEATAALQAFLQDQHGAPGLPEVHAQLSQDLHGALRASEASELADAYGQAVQQRHRLRHAWQACFALHRLDALVHPAVRVTAPLLQRMRVSPGPAVSTRYGLMPAREAFAQNVTPASLVGAPSLVLPLLGTSGGMPVGLQLDGCPGGDRRLLAVAAAVEGVLRA